MGREVACHPPVEGSGRLRDDEEAHVGVLHAAVLGALAEVRAGAGGAEAPDVVLAGDGIDLSAELGHPEAVDHVVGVDADLDGPPDGNMDLVCRREPLCGVAHLPPPSLPDHLDAQGVALRPP